MHGGGNHLFKQFVLVGMLAFDIEKTDFESTNYTSFVQVICLGWYVSL